MKAYIIPLTILNNIWWLCPPPPGGPPPPPPPPPLTILNKLWYALWSPCYYLTQIGCLWSRGPPLLFDPNLMHVVPPLPFDPNGDACGPPLLFVYPNLMHVVPPYHFDPNVTPVVPPYYLTQIWWHVVPSYHLTQMWRLWSSLTIWHANLMPVVPPLTILTKFDAVVPP